ncbi:lipopolysaccharide biosynthesis protein RfbH [Candidatus Woesebacteria bacterium]|nr:lipopolysaccharide biosynthesis protein RfbH [Candidatus Woesebacteria bacterium]
MQSSEQRLKKEIGKKIKQIFEQRKRSVKFVKGKTWIQYAGAVFDDKEISQATATLIDGWFGLGNKGDEMEKKLAHFVGTRGSVLTNSGSSANLLAVGSIMSPLFSNRLSRGDEVIVAACGFPTTINPLVIYGLIPVFLDVNSETYNIDYKDLEKALSKKTKAIFIAHTLGNPNEMDKILKFCKQHNLILLEDNCDALGSTYQGQRTGSFGLLSTQSFYPPHHMTMGEGGMIYYNDIRFDRILRSLRDWGRSCWCRGDDKSMLGACGVRFNYKVDGKPYDHKYMFSQIGYNLKPIEAQAAMGIEQIKRLPFFIKKRKQNFERMYTYAKRWEKYFILPKSLPKADPCWFSFVLTIRDEAKFTRHQLTMFLEERKIQTRPLFGGNMTKQPAYINQTFRQIGKLTNSDRILHNTFFTGIYPGLNSRHIDYIAESIDDFVKRYG